MKTLLSLLLLVLNCTAANWFVSTAGNNTNLGTTATSPWATITCALITSNAVVSAGDTVYIGPGIYRETLVLTKSFTTNNPVVIQGDPRNELGFVGVTAQPVRWTAHPTNDKTDGSATVCSASTFDGYTWNDIWFDGGDNIAWACSNGGMNHILNRCCFTGYSVSGAITVNVATDTGAYLTLNNCIVDGAWGSVYVNPQATPTSAEVDLQIHINNSVLVPSQGVFISDKGGTYPFAGVDLDSCTIMGYYGFRYATTAANNGTVKNVIRRCIISGNAGISTSATKTVVDEDWNLFWSATPRTAGEAAGANSQTKYAKIWNLGQYTLWFNRPELPYSLPAVSPAAGFDASGANMLADFYGRMRPSGGGITWSTTNSSAGAIEAHDFGVRDTTVKNAGLASVKLTGPGDHQIVLPVSARPTQFTVRAAYGDLYTGTLPSVQIIAQPNIGITNETKTVSVGTTNTFELLTFTSQTPTAAGAVIMRFISNSTAGTGQAWFDAVGRNY